MQFCGFFETTGLLVRNGYIPLADIMGLYEVSILRTDNAFRAHIHNRRGEPGAQTIYEDFSWPVRETLTVIAARR